jgi:hypothetical protein
MAALQSRPEECHLFLRLTQISMGWNNPVISGQKPEIAL